MNQTETYIVDGNAFPPKQDGNYYAKVVRGASGDNYVSSQWIETNSNVSGKAYRLRFNIRSHTPTASVSGMVVQRFPKDGTDWTQVGSYLPIIQATNSWQEKSHVVVMPTPSNGNTTSRIRVVLRGNNESFIQPIYYDNIRIEEVTSGSLSCGTRCESNQQCAEGLSCYQPMQFNGSEWEDVTDNVGALGSGPITGWDTMFLANGTRIQNLIKGGMLFSRLGDNTQPWRQIDFTCSGEDTDATCCENTGACGDSLLENPNDKLYGINLYQANATDIQVHITRQESGVFAKTIKIDQLDTLFMPTIRSSAGWTNQTQLANFNQLDGEMYLSFTQGNDAKGNRVQHLVKFDTSDPVTTYVYRRYGWLNRGYSNWIPLINSTNQTKDIDFEFGNKETVGVIASVDPLFANNAHYNYVIRGKISTANEVPSLEDTRLYYFDPAKVGYSAGVCRNVYSPTKTCDSDLAQPSQLAVNFRCTDGVANLTWKKNAEMGTAPNYYEIAICKSGDCATEAKLEQSIVHKIGFNASGTGSFTASYPGGFSKGDRYDFAMRPALYENETRVKVGAWTDVVSKTMAGPLGDMNADCDVDFTDYTDFLAALRSPYAPPALFEKMIYFFNSLIANMGTSN
jgi:hypothetical protein